MSGEGMSTEVAPPTASSPTTYMLDDDAVDVGAHRLHVVGVPQQDPHDGQEAQTVQ